MKLYEFSILLKVQMYHGTFLWFNVTTCMNSCYFKLACYYVNFKVSSSIVWWGSWSSIFNYLCSVSKIIVHPFVFFIWSLHCRSFFDFRFLFTPRYLQPFLNSLIFIIFRKIKVCSNFVMFLYKYSFSTWWKLHNIMTTNHNSSTVPS